MASIFGEMVSTSVLDTLESLLRKGHELSLSSLGGESAIAAEATLLAKSPFFDDILHVLATSWNALTRPKEMGALVVEGFARNERPIAFADALDALFNAQELMHAVAKPLFDVLILRGTQERHERPLISALALEGALRLALAGQVSKFKLLGTFDELGEGEMEPFVTKVARLIGVAVDAWRVREPIAILEKLLPVPGAEDEVAFELGMAEMSFALEATTEENILVGLRQARTWFSRAERASECRLDAAAYRGVIDVVLGFSAGRATAPVREAAKRAEEAVRLRDAWLVSENMPNWLRPRAIATAEWAKLATELAYVAENLERESWLHALEILEQVLNVYRSTRTAIGSTNRIGIVIGPRIEAAFIEKRALLAHLDDWLGYANENVEMRGVAEQLRTRIRERANSPPEPLGKA